MSDLDIRIEGCAGRITLTRPKALNALTWEMCRDVSRALDEWRDDECVSLVVMDGTGDRAFCAGGDIAEMYRRGTSGDFDFGRGFWADEYRMNRKLYHYPKPVAAFMHGFTMGGGVGIGCHGSHRVVCESSQLAMPECGIGLIPDVGGTLLLARAPGRLGEYLGLGGARMGPADAIHAGFADHYVPQAAWPELIAALERTGEWHRIEAAAGDPPPGDLEQRQAEIDGLFGGASIAEVLAALANSEAPFATETLGVLGRNSPLSMACTLELIRRARAADTIEAALEQEYRFTWRSMEHADFLEGTCAAVIDKDRQPRWLHERVSDVSADEVERMLAPLGDETLDWEEA
ncbi:enoyl-CoA hydratase/isomerase family protein [Roseitranquillus sediminis]|uniref:enoyl-CoA hydratase/isomerase family protein n=1 Tax=Roseitranquillus sediminis TaxID=2809051 RepID=UPI001D0C8A63|nr:enoyl-CoA hydratase/isomerase family protein [Roseitranquillus sediminis]MBM9594077.1 enoyl-CoA hydratase/isomerase family protein [Roseitranquillus sediminis]